MQIVFYNMNSCDLENIINRYGFVVNISYKDYVSSANCALYRYIMLIN